jgi:hypothetical protein
LRNDEGNRKGAKNAKDFGLTGVSVGEKQIFPEDDWQALWARDERY